MFKKYAENIELMNEVLNIHDFINTPVRQLSLGQRMRGDLAAAMLHSPPILFLDEPTIGLDTEAKYAIRKFILEINRLRNLTVILTTHDLEDVEALCQRLIVVNHGQVVEDGPLENMIQKLAPHRILVVELSQPHDDLTHPKAEVIQKNGRKVWYRFEKTRITASQLIADLSTKLPIQDISVKEPDIEQVIREVYKSGKK